MNIPVNISYNERAAIVKAEEFIAREIEYMENSFRSDKLKNMPGYNELRSVEINLRSLLRKLRQNKYEATAQ